MIVAADVPDADFGPTLVTTVVLFVIDRMTVLSLISELVARITAPMSADVQAFNANPDATPDQVGTAQEPGTEQRQPRERRSRDRYGRDRRERGDRTERGDGEGQEQGAATPGERTDIAAMAEKPAVFVPNPVDVPTTVAPAAMQSVAPVIVAAPASLVAPVAPAPVVRAAPAVKPAAAPAVADTAGREFPKVQGYELPMQDLTAVAQSSGLQWVNSDRSKIAEVNAAIAAEPKRVHVPRERPVAAASTVSPLVLVETKRDLGTMPLPFETPPV